MSNYDWVKVLEERTPTAKTEHKCKECFRIIQPKEKYFLEKYIWEGAFYTHKTCKHCYEVRKFILFEYGEFLYSGLYEDLTNSSWGKKDWKPRLFAVGMSKKWRDKRGKLWKIIKN